MDILNPMTYDVEEDKLREHTKYNQMDRLLLRLEFQQQLVLTDTIIVAVEYDGGVIISAYTRITLTIIRDGCACFAIIDHNSVERVDILGNDLPQVVDL
ncbi:unnamed protein product [Adineta steineri]|uniref:Uncharacterized protein n=1 Tax=Adineta steineri TaxID=433720 RepID=A0A814YXX0_9BILA|nr:unnamed protein product [Adineta steineri]CAF1234988.1 unnamed protein product [Adineta steineri]